MEPTKRKLEDEPNNDDSNTCMPYKDFSVFRTINKNTQSKTICVCGKFGSNGEQSQTVETAVVLLEKLPFTDNEVAEILSDNTIAKRILQNDIYSSFELKPVKPTFDIKATMIYPATDRHIMKYTKQAIHIIDETAADYASITLPYIESESFSMQWVYNILEHKTEAERIVFEDSNKETGFILLPDMKWTGKDTLEMYLVAIAHKHGIRSLRDLRTEHLPLLRNILHSGKDAIKSRYGVPSDKLRVYLHYQPSYYHLHVHFTHVDFDAPGSGVQKAHLLCDVIDNIELSGSYYAHKTLSFMLRQLDKLCSKYEQAGRISSSATSEGTNS